MTAIEADDETGETGQRCWCCANEFRPAELVRLGSHPEVGLCANCAKWVWRRTQHSQDQTLGGVAPAVRRLVFRTRERVISAGLHNRPVIGRCLRWIDRRLP